MTFTIARITSEQTLPLRQKVLWPHHPIEQSQVDGDYDALHYGGFVDRQLVSVASLFADGKSMRLRKFATDPSYQGQGFGSLMLAHLYQEARGCGAKSFWFDARESALPFYERNGYIAEGPRFYKSEIPYRRVVRQITD